MMQLRPVTIPLLGLILLLSAGAQECRAQVAPEPELHFSVTEADIHNEFYRDGPVAAHTVLTSGPKPRLIVAFPAGNSGVSLWFREGARPARWAKPMHMQPVKVARESGPLHGVGMDLEVTVPALTLEKAVLGNIRTIRSYLHEKTVDARLDVAVAREGDVYVWQRARLDGIGGYRIALEPTSGTTVAETVGGFTLNAGDDGKIRFHLTALSGDAPLTPIGKDRILLSGAAEDALSRNILAFLSYGEKLLAGSWRFNTYFGRDTLLSTALLMPVLEDSVIDAALGSVIERLAATGEVAHEEDIGEFAVLRQLERGGKAEAKPVYDYAMVDEDYMLAPVLARYLGDRRAGLANLRILLERKTTGGERYGDALMRNLRLVLASAEAFAAEPAPENLIAIEEGMRVGEWRDSQEGLGNGRFAYSVNVVLVPAALEAMVKLEEAGVLAPYAAADELAPARERAAVWEAIAPMLFDVTIPADRARAEISAYAATQGVPADEALAVVDADGMRFPALSLDAAGRPVPVVQSDPGFLLFFRDPAPELIERSLDGVLVPFPAGLMTPVGMVVANPVYADDALEAIFT
ncbi:MAG: hypothetical protein ACSLE2_13510, partial [Lysobacterales bacterium]